MKFFNTLNNKDSKTYLKYKKLLSKQLNFSIEQISVSKDIIKILEEFYVVNNKKNKGINIIKNPILEPLSLFMLNINAIEIKSTNLKKTYVKSLKNNNLISSGILIRSDLELNFLLYFYLGKTLEFLKNNQWLDFYKLSLKIFLGKETIESNDNKIQKTFLIPFFGHDFMNFEKKIHINDLIDYLKKSNIEVFLKNLKKVSALEQLKEPDINYLYNNIFNNFENWKNQIHIYDVLSNLVHPTAIQNIFEIYDFDIRTNANKKIIDLKDIKKFEESLFFNSDAIVNAINFLSRPDTFKFIAIIIYLNYRKMYSEKHYQIYNHINIKLLKENNAGEQKVQNLNTKNILVTKEKK